MTYCLEPLGEQHLDQILAWRNHGDVRINMYNTHLITPDEHAKWFQSLKNQQNKQYFIFLKDDIPSGVIGYTDIDRKNNISSWMFYSRDTAVRGIGSLMEFAALDYAFDKLGLEKLWCEVLDFNPAVIKFHHKYGFETEGIFVKHYLRDGKRYDIHRLAIFRNIWQDKRPQFEQKLRKFL